MNVDNAIGTVITYPRKPIGSSDVVSATNNEGQLSQNERSTVSDYLLFQRHLRGNHEALMMLFDRHHQKLWLYVAKMVGDTHSANDVMQDLWEKVIYLRQKREKAPENPAGYLFRTARNLCLNSLRKRKGAIGVEELSESEHPTAEPLEPSRNEELLQIALKQLPESQREILVLNAWSGYSFDEIAQILNKQPGAIHTTAWRARKRLGVIMAELMQQDNPERE